ncbi:MAG: HD domain-containing protein [Desulfatiglandaceae bacterium]
MKADDRVNDCYLVTQKRLAKTKNGKPFISLTLADRTGAVEAKIWDRADVLSSRFLEGDVIEVEGIAGSYRNQLQLTVSRLKVMEEEVDKGLFMERAPDDPAEMMRELRELLKGVSNIHLRRLIEHFLGDREFTARFQEAPAAKNFHHAYMGGLLEHTLMVCRLTLQVAEHYPYLNRDLLLTAAFVHDIGKVRELAFMPQIEYTDEGRLVGHVVLGAAMVDERLHGIKDFPEDLAVKLKHLILSHHGQYDFGSPKVPKFLEAFALHLIDDLDAKLNGLARFMDQDRKEGAWTEFNRLFGRYFLKGELQAGDEGAGEQPEKENAQGTLFSAGP